MRRRNSVCSFDNLVRAKFKISERNGFEILWEKENIGGIVEVSTVINLLLLPNLLDEPQAVRTLERRKSRIN